MKLLVFGSQDFARTVEALALDCGHEVAGFVDDFNQGAGVVGTSQSIRDSHPPGTFAVALAIGYRNLPGRFDAWQRIRDAGYEMPPLIHPRAYVASDARVGQGTMVMAGAVVDVRACVGDVAVLWPGACVNHDAMIGCNTFISPNVTVCGHARIGASSFVGAASAIVDYGIVPDGTFLPMLSRWVAREGQR